jgi:hypothetical protein
MLWTFIFARHAAVSSMFFLLSPVYACHTSTDASLPCDVLALTLPPLARRHAHAWVLCYQRSH